MLILAMCLSLVALIVFILVLIKQFQNGGAVQGIIGIVTCGIWTFIWGWMNANKLNIRNLMLIWTAIIVLNLIIRFTVGVPPGFPGMPAAGPTP